MHNALPSIHVNDAITYVLWSKLICFNFALIVNIKVVSFLHFAYLLSYLSTGR